MAEFEKTDYKTAHKVSEKVSLLHLLTPTLCDDSGAVW